MTPKNRREAKDLIAPAMQGVVNVLAGLQYVEGQIEVIANHIDRLETLSLSKRLRWLLTGRLPAIPVPVAAPPHPPAKPARSRVKK